MDLSLKSLQEAVKIRERIEALEKRLKGLFQEPTQTFATAAKDAVRCGEEVGESTRTSPDEGKGCRSRRRERTQAATHECRS